MDFREVRREHNQVQKTRVEEGFRSDMNFESQMLETLNMNNGYLLIILRLMDEFTILKINGVNQAGKLTPEYYYQLWEILDMIINYISCKMDDSLKKNIKKRMDDLFDRVNTCFTNHSNGEMFMNVFESRRLRKDLGQVFEDLLENMEKRGMLTYKAEDPSKAMGDFTD